MDVNLTTERLTLREPSLLDAEQLFQLMSTFELTEFLTWEEHTKIETTKALIENLILSQNNDKGYHWCICLEKDVIGLVSLIDVKRKIRTWTLNRAELSYWIGVKYQGKGYATEASRTILEFGFNNLNFHKIIIAHAAKNIESKSICNKLGFTQYAHEHDAFNKNGVWHDLIWYELIKK